MIGIEEACPPADTSSVRVPGGDKWSKTTKETLGGSEVSEANGVLLNSDHHSDTILIKKQRGRPLLVVLF